MMGMMEDGNHEVDSSNGSESSYDDDEVFLKVITEDKRKVNYSKVKEELLNVIERKRWKSDALHYEDVGEDVYIKVSRRPNEDFGLTLICGEVFTPSWPAIIDIKKNSPASEVNLKIGDQIKELLGIDTSTLVHWQLVGLFTNASDEITMTVRRGLDRSHTTFDWYKHPFSSVRQDFEELVISDDKVRSTVHRGGNCTCHYRCADTHRARVALKSFKLEDNQNAIDGNNIVCHKRTISESSASKLCSVNGRERNRVYDGGQEKCRHNGHIYPSDEGEYLTNEIERIYEEKSHLEVVRHSLSDSSSSMSSTLSDSTASSGTTFSDQIGGNQCNWMERVMNPTDSCTYSDDLFDDVFDKSSDNSRVKYIPRSSGYKISESFRRKKKKKGTIVRAGDESKHALRCNDISDNTLLLTVWVIDRRKLGLQLGGGSVSAYGDSNVKIIDIKKTGTAFGAFRVGDEILEIGGVITNGLNVYDVNRIISNLEGQYVEFKIFRPKCY